MQDFFHQQYEWSSPIDQRFVIFPQRDKVDCELLDKFRIGVASFYLTTSESVISYDSMRFTAPKFNSSHLKIDGWKPILSLGMRNFQGRTVELPGSSDGISGTLHQPKEACHTGSYHIAGTPCSDHSFVAVHVLPWWTASRFDRMIWDISLKNLSQNETTWQHVLSTQCKCGPDLCNVPSHCFCSNELFVLACPFQKFWPGKKQQKAGFWPMHSFFLRWWKYMEKSKPEWAVSFTL